MKASVLIAAALALSACSTLGLQTEKQKVAAVCVTASASLRVLAVANSEGKLSEEARGAVRAAVAVLTPVCDAESPPSLTEAQRAALLGAISALQVEAARAQGEKK